MNWKISAAFAAASFFGVGALVYLLLHKDEDNEAGLLLKTFKTTIVEVKIPKELVGAVIGKGGITIKEIESKSDTTIKVINDISADFKVCVIRGKLECTEYAKCLIQEIIMSQSCIEIFEMDIPSVACGKIIGKGGGNIRMIQRNTKARLFIEENVMSSEVSERKLVIKGTPEQVLMAKTIIEQILEEEKFFKSTAGNMMPDGLNRTHHKHLPSTKEEQNEAGSYRQKEKSIGNGNNDLLEVNMSAIESPDRFWLQNQGASSEDLNRLVDEMTDYYSKEENKRLHKLENLKVGQIVAAFRSFYGRWFRAKILDIQINSDGKEPEVLLHDVDLGDTEKCKKGDVYELKTDFLNLRFQAIECTLAKVKPRDSAWSKEAINYLKGLKHFGAWHSMAVKILTYVERPTKRKKEMSLIPCVELYNIHGYKVFNVAEVLVERGLAVWVEGEEKEKVKEKEEEEEEVRTSLVENPMSDSALEENRKRISPFEEMWW